MPNKGFVLRSTFVVFFYHILYMQIPKCQIKTKKVKYILMLHAAANAVMQDAAT